MISVNEAIALVKKHSLLGKREIIPLTNAIGLHLAADVTSRINMPPFNQSAMDGYAINYSDDIETFEVIGEVAAGESGNQFNLKLGEATRIFTGAAVPNGANTVVKQEIVELNVNSIRFTEKVKVNQNIRLIGEQIKKHELALKKGTVITAASIGFLATLGISEIEVYQKPKISIVVTGNELVSSGKPLPFGSIYESNSAMLVAALKSFGFNEVHVQIVSDDYQITENALINASSENDFVILSGGISVGDYDYVGKALNELNAEQVFYKVAQKPGKPLYFGKINNSLIFALPGNPAAALTCFYIYVLDALQHFIGNSKPGLVKAKLALSNDFSHPGFRSQLLKAKTDFNQVEILPMQSSAMLRSFADANCIVFIPQEKTEVFQGEYVNCWLITQ